MKPTYRISPSFLMSYGGCQRRILRGVVERLEPKNQPTSIEMLFGSSFHKFRELFAKIGMEQEAFALQQARKVFTDGLLNIYPIAKTKAHITEDYLVTACLQFASTYPLKTTVGDFMFCFDSSGDPLTEHHFSVPIYSCDEFDVALTGVIDGIGIIGQTLVIEDTKTTSQYNKEEYFEAYSNSPQMLFYYYIANKIAEAFPTSAFAELKARTSFFSVSIFGVFMKTRQVEFERSPLINFSDYKLKNYSDSIENKLLEIIDVIHEGHYLKTGMVTGACSSYKSKCPFLKACNEDSDEEENNTIRISYATRK